MILHKQVITQDAGTNWTSVSNSGRACEILYTTSTGRIITSYLTRGIWYSDNEGIDWTPTNNNDGYKCTAICSMSTGRIIAAIESNTNGYICYSDDNGATWKKQNGTRISHCQALCVTPTGRIIAACSNEQGVWHSDDRGVNWTQHGMTGYNWCSLCVTSTGRVIIGSSSSGIWYSDDNGVNWVQSNHTSGNSNAFCITSTGRILTTSVAEAKIRYSDDNGVTWGVATSTLNSAAYHFCTTLTGRIICYNTSDCYYSDNNGLTWTRVEYRGGRAMCVTSTGSIILSKSSGSYDIMRSDPVTVQVAKYTSKYLDQNGAQEIVTQFKAYCDSLVGGA